MNNVIDFESNNTVQEKKKQEIINMVIDDRNMEAFFKSAFGCRTSCGIKMIL